MGRNVLRILLLLCCTLQAYVGQRKFVSITYIYDFLLTCLICFLSHISPSFMEAHKAKSKDICSCAACSKRILTI
jgi:hypothetical protein